MFGRYLLYLTCKIFLIFELFRSRYFRTRLVSYSFEKDTPQKTKATRIPPPNPNSNAKAFDDFLVSVALEGKLHLVAHVYLLT